MSINVNIMTCMRCYCSMNKDVMFLWESKWKSITSQYAMVIMPFSNEGKLDVLADVFPTEIFNLFQKAHNVFTENNLMVIS